MSSGLRASSATAFVVLACALAWPDVALAQRPRPAAPAGPAPPAHTGPVDVETAEQLYAKLEYEHANAVAERVVKKSGLTHEQLARAYRILAITYAVLDKQDQAREAFLQLLTCDPDYQVDPNLGPKVNTPFTEARGSFRSLPHKPGIDVSAALSVGGGTLRVTTRDPTRVVKKIQVGYRWASSGEYVVSHVAAGEAVSVEVAPAPAGRTRLDFYAQALDERDNPVLEAGNGRVPRSAFAEAGAGPPGGGVAPRKSEGGSFFGGPLFWVLTSAAVAGGGAALFFTLRPHEPPTSASLAPIIRCGDDRCS